MKRILGLVAVLTIALVGCGASDEAVTYKGEATNADGDVATVTYVMTGDDITDTVFNETKGGSDKRTMVTNGEYDMGGEKTWSEQVDALGTYVDENDKLPTLDAEGKDVDGVTTATIGLTNLSAAFESAKAE